MEKTFKIAPIPKGQWDSSVQYEYLDIVILDGDSYIAKQPSKNKNPAKVSNGTYWKLFAQGGAAATISVGTVNTGEPNSEASVSNSGTSNAAVLNFVIPRGPVGSRGMDGARGPQGSQGIQGPAGPTGPIGPIGLMGSKGDKGDTGDPAPASIVQPAVTSWLSNNIAAATSTVLDASLSLVNAAAQAKAVGDSIDNILNIFAVDFSEASTYSFYDHVIYPSNNPRLYRCQVASCSGAWDINNWEKVRVGNIHKRLRSILMSNIFTADQQYEIGDYTGRSNDLYRCKIAKPSNVAWNANNWEKTTITKELKTLNDKVITNISANISRYKNTFGYKNTFVKPINLDTVAYAGRTYRDIFITNNLSPWKGFDDFNSTTISSYIKSGQPTIQESPIFHGNTLKCFNNNETDTESQQIHLPKNQRLTFQTGHILLMCVNVQCNAYTSGSIGLHLSKSGGFSLSARISRTTVGWQSLINRGKVTENGNDLDLYAGSFTASGLVGKLNGYVDDTILVDLTEVFEAGNEPTLEICKNLFAEYNDILSGGTQFPIGLYNFDYNKSYNAFIKAMMKKAESIGMKHTNTNTPSGYTAAVVDNNNFAPKIQENGKLDTSIQITSTSTALDMLKLLTVATSYDELCKIWSTEEKIIHVRRIEEDQQTNKRYEVIKEIPIHSTFIGQDDDNNDPFSFQKPYDLDSVENFNENTIYHRHDYVIQNNELWRCTSTQTKAMDWSSYPSGVWTDDFSNTKTHARYYVLGGKTGHLSSTGVLLMCACNDEGETLCGVVHNGGSKINRFAGMREAFFNAFKVLHGENPVPLTAGYVDNIAVWELPKFNTKMLGNNFYPKLLYSLEENEIFATASSMKVLAVITALDYITDLQDTYTFQECDTYLGPGSSGNVFQANDVISIEDLLYAVILPSSNTGATALAHYVGNLILQKDLNNAIETKRIPGIQIMPNALENKEIEVIESDGNE